MVKPQEINYKVFNGVRGLLILLLLLSNILVSSPLISAIFSNVFLLFIGFADTQNILLFERERKAYLKEKFIDQYYPLAVVVLITSIFLFLLQMNYIGNFSFEAISSIFYVENLYYLFNSTVLEKIPFSPFRNFYFISLVMNMRFICYGLSYLKSDVKEILLTTILSLLSLIGFIICSTFMSSTIPFIMNPLLRFFTYGIGILLGFYSTLGAGKDKKKNNDFHITAILVLMIAFIGIDILYSLPIFVVTVLSTIMAGVLVLAIWQNNGGFNTFFINSIFQYLGRNAYIIFLIICPIFYFLSLYLDNWLSILLSMIAIPISEYISIFLYDKKFRDHSVIIITCLIIGMHLLSFYLIRTDPLPTHSKQTIEENREEEENTEEEGESILTEFQPSSDIQVQVEQINAQMPAYFLSNEDLGHLHNKQGYLISDGFASSEVNEFQRILPSFQFLDLKSKEYVDRKEEILQLIENIPNKETPVVLQLGFEDSIAYDDFNLMVKEMKHDAIYLVNLGGDRAWKRQYNDSLRNLASNHENVHLIDWNQAIDHQTNFYDEEGKYIEPAGQKVLVQIIGHSLIEKVGDKKN